MINMIQKEELDQILSFVASRWNATVQEPNNKAKENLPNGFCQIKKFFQMKI